jgi:uncharacterized protein (TIGR02217 family)
MAFIETPRFPLEVSFNASGGPEYLTEIVTVNSGDESANQVWSQARHKFEVSQTAVAAHWQALKAFFHIAAGRAGKFRVKDPTDFECPDASGTGVIGTGLGTGYPTGQMGKKYVSGSYTRIREIHKPITTVAPAIYKNGVLLVEGLLAGQETPDLSTGIVTFYATAKTITGITQAATAVVTAAAHGFTGTQTVYITGVLGMTDVNGIAFVIGSVTTNTFELTGINSTGYGAYTSGGTAALYPQPTDTLTWVGEFDVPCRFDTDFLKRTIIDKQKNGDLIVECDSVPLIEVRVP